MEIEAALPQLLTNYRRGVLVPFIGSGMSVPACPAWIPLLRALARRARHPISPELQRAFDEGRTSSTDLYRLADLCVRRLTARGRDTLAHACREALGVTADLSIPPQTEALAEIHWPLVLSTNYDDLLLRAAHRRHARAVAAGQRSAFLPPLFEIAGQAVQDCHAVLHSLDVVTPPLVWALQGYLGDRTLTHTPIDDRRAARFEREVVLGHQQYQSVINAQPHLRRAVAEVFRRRSLLFLGSGVQEDYLINLFSEIIHHHGTSAHRHFAVFHAMQRAQIDEAFFRLRLGIEPLFVADFAEVPALLRRLRSNISNSPPDHHERVFSCVPYELAFRFASGDGAFTLRLRNDAVGPPMGTTSCVGVSVGRSTTGPMLGTKAKAVLRAAEVAEAAWNHWLPQDDGRYVYRHATHRQLFAIAARDHGATSTDCRHLLVIPTALDAFLACVDREGYDSATITLLAAGGSRPWPALYPFVMMLSSIRELARNPPTRLRELVVSITDPTLWYPLLAGKIPVELLLSTNAATVRVHVVGDAGDELESYVLTLTSATVAEVARQCDLPPGPWNVSVYPVPHGDRGLVTNWADLAVVPGATVTFIASTDERDASFMHVDREGDAR